MDTHRRDLLKSLAAAGALGLAGPYARNAAAQVPETTRIRMVKFPSICQAPVYIAEELLRAEGFTDITYVDGAPFAAGPKTYEILSEGTVDMAVQFAAPERAAGRRAAIQLWMSAITTSFSMSLSRS
jgi:NitT/TauT family transport system substrate-binding protein